MTTQAHPEGGSLLTTRALNVLATGLTEALNEARGVLDPTATPVGEHLSQPLDQLIDEFRSRRVRIAVFGEVKAGKSTLLNAIAGSRLSPVAFDPLTSIPVRVTYGPSTLWRVGDQLLENLDELERLMRGAPFSGAEVVVETPLDLLQLGGQVDLMDTPGLGSHAEYDAVTEETLHSLDAIILVVRYPALFTQFTRHLVERLKADIAKLFVVWNLDAGCGELSAEEREIHARSLKEKVASTNELFLVDARAGLRAGPDRHGRATSGLAELCDALGRFVLSNQRDIVALREAAKRGIVWLEAIQAPLRERMTEVDQRVREAQARIDKLRQRADQEIEGLRLALEDFDKGMQTTAREASEAAGARAKALRSSLAAARRGWIWDGHLLRLENAVKNAFRQFWTDAAAGSQKARDQFFTAAAAFGAEMSLSPRSANEPPFVRLTTEDRNVKASSGGLKILRRALWSAWYLPGLGDLEQKILASELATEQAWIEASAAAALEGGRQLTQKRISSVSERVGKEVAAVMGETGFEAYSAELGHLTQGLPHLVGQIKTVRDLAEQARELL